MGKRTNRKGRRNYDSFVQIKRFMLNHHSWLDLDPKARCIYIELRKLYNGQNNGELWLSCRDAGKVAKCGKSTAGKMFIQLIDHGYIKLHGKGYFGNKHATTWILTNESYNGQLRTDEWVHWPGKKNGSTHNCTDSPPNRTEPPLTEKETIESVQPQVLKEVI